MKTSEQISELAGALAKAQGMFTAAERDHVAKVQSKKGEGSSYSYSYADLAGYLDVCREPLSANGLSFVQSPKVMQNVVSVTTILFHASGQYIEFDPLEMVTGDIGPQAIGSILTYCRRYALSAALGMASEADDDGNSGSGNSAETSRKEAPKCPKCGTNEHVIKGREEYGGGWLCWKNRGGCGEKWQVVQELADQTGMTTGDKIQPPSNGKHSDAEEIEAFNRYSQWFASIWTGESYEKLEGKLSKEIAGKPYQSSLREKLKICMERASWRTQLEMADAIGDEAFKDVLTDMRKTLPIPGDRPLKDVEAFCEWAFSANPSPFSEKQQASMLKELEKLQTKHAQPAGAR